MKSRPTSINVSISSASGDATAVEDLIKAVENFDESSDIFPEELNAFISHVAKTGNILSTWPKVQKVFLHKLKSVMDVFYEESPYKELKVNANCENESFEYLREFFIKQAMQFESPPFTFQRLCELLEQPKRNYTKCEKFMRALEKNLTVVSSWQYPPRLSLNTSTAVNGSSDFSTPVKSDPVTVSVGMRYPVPQTSLPPSPMLSGSSNNITHHPGFITNLSQALDAAEKEKENEDVEVAAAAVTVVVASASCKDSNSGSPPAVATGGDDDSVMSDVVTSSSSSCESEKKSTSDDDEDTKPDDLEMSNGEEKETPEDAEAAAAVVASPSTEVKDESDDAKVDNNEATAATPQESSEESESTKPDDGDDSNKPSSSPVVEAAATAAATAAAAAAAPAAAEAAEAAEAAAAVEAATTVAAVPQQVETTVEAMVTDAVENATTTEAENDDAFKTSTKPPPQSPKRKHCKVTAGDDEGDPAEIPQSPAKRLKIAESPNTKEAVSGEDGDVSSTTPEEDSDDNVTTTTTTTTSSSTLSATEND